MNLYVSNRLERIAAELARVTVSAPLPPMKKEIIVVQSKGMERWLSMRLAGLTGVFANAEFPFPGAVIREIFEKVLPWPLEIDPYDTDILTWKIFSLLPSLTGLPEFAPLRLYLSGESSELKLFQLSEKISALFDQYVMYRPEMILDWESGAEDHWQAVLWRKISELNGSVHKAAFGKMFFDKMASDPPAFSDFATRISIFGISSLPPFFIKVFAAVSSIIEINLFLLNPCEREWFGILSEKEIASKLKKTNLDSDELYLESGNNLLASLGALGREFFGLIFDTDGLSDFSAFVPGGGDSMLSIIQNDILTLEDISGESENAIIKTTIDPGDKSIRICSCHNKMREVETLYENLLEMFADDPELLPGDILVMAPDIEDYAPYIQAVFDDPHDKSMRIPYGIADRSMRKESRLVDVWLEIIDMNAGRYGADTVLSLLECEAVRARFGISEDSLEKIRSWIRRARIYWGVDGKSKVSLGLPDFSQNTWKAGLDSLLLGYALPGGGELVFEGVAPFDEIEGGEAVVLGRFIEFTSALFSAASSLSTGRKIDEWADSFSTVFDSMFAPDEDSLSEATTVRRTLDTLRSLRDSSGFDGEIELPAVRAWLEKHLDDRNAAFGFISGGVTFCAMVPMRSIPFKVICLTGMNYDSYPRRVGTPGFDLMAAEPKPCDRSRKKDDRYLFLETLISAREKLYISYIGRSMDDNSAAPPSVLISELLDYIAKRFELSDGGAPESLIFIEHRLQPFSPEYFKGAEKLFSYSPGNCESAICSLSSRKNIQPLISAGLPAPDSEWLKIDIPSLCSFFANPARFLLTKRIGMNLESDFSAVENTEPFSLGGLEKYAFENRLIDGLMDGKNIDYIKHAAKTAGVMPHGAAGDYQFLSTISGVESFAAKVSKYRVPPIKQFDVDLEISDFRITGTIDGVTSLGLLRFRNSALNVKARDQLTIWIQHLILNILKPEGAPLRSILIGNDFVWTFKEIENPEPILLELLELYRRGLSEPLRLFPRASLSFADDVLLNEKSEGLALEKAREKALNNWLGNDFVYSADSADPYLSICFTEENPINSDFEELAIAVYGPLFEARNAEKIS